MANLPVRGAHVAVALPAFVWFARHDELTARYTIPFALTDGLPISDSPFMVGETCLTPEMSVAVRAGDSNPRLYTRRARHAAAAFQVARMCHRYGIPCRTLYIYAVWPWLLSGSLSRDNYG